MYIEPCLVGVLLTVFAEVIFLVVWAFAYSLYTYKREEDDDDEDE